MTYEDLSFFGDTYSGGANVSVRMVDGGGTEQSLAEAIALPGGNAAVQLRTVDFADFTSSNVVEWRFYPYGTDVSSHGIRFDDVMLHGTANLPSGVIPEPMTMLAVGLGIASLGGYIRKRRRA